MSPTPKSVKIAISGWTLTSSDLQIYGENIHALFGVGVGAAIAESKPGI